MLRRALLAIAMFGMAAHAQAADMPEALRGSLSGSATTVWQGFYVGAQGAWASSDQTFSGSTMDHSVFNNLISGNPIGEIAGISAPTPFGTSWKGSAPYGAFAGYNWQWDYAVLGLEMSYLHGNLGGSVSAARQFASQAALSDGLFHNPLVTSTSTMAVSDYATFRARAAYAYNCFLPYAFGGFALGYADVSTSARINDSVSATANGPFTALPPLSATHAGENHLIYGYSGGLGIDINVITGLFVRAEWEYVRFTQQVDMNVNTLRLGLGYKF
jgi:opacity protein-like surface antigen